MHGREKHNPSVLSLTMLSTICFRERHKVLIMHLDSYEILLLLCVREGISFWVLSAMFLETWRLSLVIIILPRTAAESMFSQGLYVLKPGIAALGNGITRDCSKGESLDLRLTNFFESALCFSSISQNFGHSIKYTQWEFPFAHSRLVASGFPSNKVNKGCLLCLLLT